MDREKQARKPFVPSGEFWLGVATVFILVTLVATYGQRIVSWFDAG